MTDPSLASVEQFAEHLRDHVRGGGNVYPFAVGMISGVVTSFHRVDARKLDDVRDILTALSQVTNEITQPIGERRLVGDGGVWAVPVAGGPVEVDPPWNPQSGFFEPGRVPELVGDDPPEGFVPASAPSTGPSEPVTVYFSFGHGQTDPDTGKNLLDHYVTIVGPSYSACREAMFASRFGQAWAFDYIAGSAAANEWIPQWTEHERIDLLASGS
jgi:hypothetical protein